MGTRLLSGLTVLLAAAPAARAGTWYVDAVNGDDAHSGASWSEAWRTISHAAASTGWSETIWIAPGTYDLALGETFPIAMQSCSFVGVAGPELTIVDGGGVPRLFEGDDWHGTALLEGLWLRDAGNAVYMNVTCFMDWCDSEVVLRDVRVSGTSGAALHGHVWTDWFDAELFLRLERVVIEQCARAVELSTFCDPNHPTEAPVAYGHLACLDSLVVDNGSGLWGSCWGWSDSVDLAVRRSTIAGNPGGGVVAGTPMVYGSVQDSVLFANGLDVAGPIGVAYSCTERGPYPGPGNVAGDPRFVDPAQGDWRPGFGSPALDVGAGPFPPTDLAGTPRPLDGDLDLALAPDMGALELAPLAARGAARIGETLTVELFGPEGGTALVLAALGPLDARRWTPFGWSFLPPDARRLARPAVHPGPPGSFDLELPDDPALVGLELALQALTTAPAAPAGAAWTNPLALWIGP